MVNNKSIQYNKMLDDVKKSVTKDIMNIYEKYQKDGKLILINNSGAGIWYDEIKINTLNQCRGSFDMISLDLFGHIETDKGYLISLSDFDACELVRFYKELLNIYKDE